MSFSEEELIRGCCRNDRQMQELLYQKYSRSMYAVALRYAKMEQEAEDILQEAFIKVFQHIEKFRGESSLAYWIKRIIINTALNHQRSKLYLYPMVDVTEMKSWGCEGNSIADIQYQELMAMVSELPDGCRIIFNLYAIEGYKHHEIATLLGISEGTSKSQYSRAKCLLQTKIGQYYTVNYGKVGELEG
ncbi:MAG: RNA polymerase sigma factor [Cyclobacteriaceae bacterium]|nr:RNA polymerase sigma factor [Cyclobacteriaceae bacterium]